MENFIKIVEIVLSWQVIFGFVLIYALILYKTEMKDYLKFKSAPISGVETCRNAFNSLKQSKDKSLLPALDSETTENIYTEYPLIESNRNHVNELQKNYGFEGLWLNTYGSQIELLEDLNMKKQEKLSNLIDFYERFLSRMPEKLKKSVGKRYSFKFYLKYLILNNLINVETQNANNPTARITELGEKFLSYIKLQYPKTVRPL